MFFWYRLTRVILDKRLLNRLLLLLWRHGLYTAWPTACYPTPPSWHTTVSLICDLDARLSTITERAIAAPLLKANSFSRQTLFHASLQPDAMDRGRWKKLIKIGWWSGWWVGECFSWYPLTRVVPDKGPSNGCRCCCVLFAAVWTQALGAFRRHLGV